jgi:archaellum component FlaC
MEERIARLEGRIEELSKRIDDLRNDMNHRFDDLRNELSGRFSDLKDSVDRLWKISLITLGGTFTILAAVIGVLLRLLLAP